MKFNRKKYQQNNKEKLKKYNKEWRKKNKEKIKEYHQKPEVRKRIKKKQKEYHKKYWKIEEFRKKRREYLQKNKEKFKERRKEYQKEWYQKNKDKLLKKSKEYGKKYRKKIENKLRATRYQKQRRESNPRFIVQSRLRCLLYNAVKRYSQIGKVIPSKKYGIDWGIVIEYLKPFPENIENYEIDHIKPLCSFDLNNPKEVKKAFAPENHQWLTKEENLKKGKNLILVG